jgi:hypothetical protein
VLCAKLGTKRTLLCAQSTTKQKAFLYTAGVTLGRKVAAALPVIPDEFQDNSYKQVTASFYQFLTSIKDFPFLFDHIK